MALGPYRRVVNSVRESDRCNTNSQRYPQCKRAKYCHPTRCTCQSRPATCSNRNLPPSIVWTGCSEALCWGAKGKRGLEVLGLSAHGDIGNMQHVFPEFGRAADRPGKYSH